MIQVFTSLEQLDFFELTRLYKSDIEEAGLLDYPELDQDERRFCAENDFYLYLQDYFFQNGGRYCIVIEQGHYISAVRFEQYQDGELLNALITDEAYRRRGYASMLLEAVLFQFATPIYSHIYINNTASILLHQKMGFRKLYDYSFMLDGTVRTDHITYVKIP